MKLMKYIGSKIKEYRINYFGKGLSQSELSRLTNIRSNSISRWESGTLSISLKSLEILSNFFNTDIANFLPRKVVKKTGKINDILFLLEDLDEKDLIEIKEIIIVKKRLNST